MVRKKIVIDDKFNNQPVFISTCVCEHSVRDARCDCQGKRGQAALAANPALQLPLGGWDSAAATDVTDALCWVEDPHVSLGP